MKSFEQRISIIQALRKPRSVNSRLAPERNTKAPPALMHLLAPHIGISRRKAAICAQWATEFGPIDDVAGPYFFCDCRPGACRDHARRKRRRERREGRSPARPVALVAA